MSVRAAAMLALLAALGGCARSHGGSTTGAPAQAPPGTEMLAAIPLGDVAGANESALAENAPNPYEGNAQAVTEGQALFTRMNCAGCHGYDAKGAMGPNLTDTYWRYGGVPAQVFKSIYEGRPQGMPAWNPALPPEEIWKLVAYIESLGGMMPAAGYQAFLQGDRVGDNVAPEVARTLPEGGFGAKSATRPANAASSASTQPEARPDAGGNPPNGEAGNAGGGLGANAANGNGGGGNAGH